MGIIVLINGYDAEPLIYVNQAFTILGPIIAKATEAPKSTAVADPSWSTYTGTYTWKHVDAEVMLIDGELTMIVPDAPNPWESRVRLTPAGLPHLKMTGVPANGELPKFEVDEAGAVTGLTAGSYYRVRKR